MGRWHDSICPAADTSRFMKVEWRQVFTDQSALGWKKTKKSFIMPVVLVRSSASNAVLFDCARQSLSQRFWGGFYERKNARFRCPYALLPTKSHGSLACIPRDLFFELHSCSRCSFLYQSQITLCSLMHAHPKPKTQQSWLATSRTCANMQSATIGLSKSPIRKV